MALEQIFIRRRKSLAGIQLDAVLRESHENIVEVSQEVVETGFVIADNAVVMPKKLTMLVNVSDTTLSFATSVGQVIDNVTGLFGSSDESNLTRSQAAYRELLDIMEALEPISVTTNLRDYENMIITSMPVIQDVDSAREITIPITLQEVTFANSETFESLPGSTEGETSERISPTKQRGRVESDVPNATSEQSYLKTVLGWLS